MSSSAASQSAKPLAGFKVLDFTHAAAGPYATMFMGDMGADIIKIEKPRGGDGTRSMGRPMPMLGPKESDYYIALNRNKKGIVLDLGTKEGADIARELVMDCDVVAQNFRPGVMERLGLGFDDLRKLRKGLVYCSISAFGPTGPWSERPANDIIMQSVSGLMGITGEVGGGPVRIGAPISDFSSGLFALSGMLAALLGRERHPEGQHVEITMLQASLNMMASFIPSTAMLGHRIKRHGRGHDQIVPYQAFMCSDNEYVMVGAFTREFWQNLARMLGHEEWITDPRFRNNPARLENRELLVGMLEKIFAQKPSTEWIRLLSEADIPTAPVYELHDAIRSEQAVHNGSLATIGDDPPIQVIRSPIQSKQWGATRDVLAPRMGADTEAVLTERLGFDVAKIEALRAKGAFGPAKEKAK